MPGKRITLPQKDRYWAERMKGHSIGDSALKAGFSKSVGDALERERRDRRPSTERERMELQRDPLTMPELSEEAKRALNDFAYFQRRYFGAVPYYWQEEAANKVVELLASPDKEYLVVNAPPGSGKTTLFTLHIPAWITVRNRQVRGMMGAATTALATRYTNRLRRALSRTLPEKADDELIQRGWAYDAETTLADDFGRFQAVGDTWTADAFVVQQYEDQGSISEKEPTWSAYGQDAGFIGGRFNFVVWDDLVDPKKQKTIEAKEALQDYWDDVSEPRLEPGGLLILQGQRLASDDLYRYCLDKMVGSEVDFDTGEMIDQRPKYHHILYKAHYEDRCQPEVTHRRDSPSYPDGCLLSNWRLPWRELNSLMTNRAERFEVVYQQQDSDPASVLVQKSWIHGHDGHPGCVDLDRDRLELPTKPDGSPALTGDLVSVMTVDPSPTKFWAILWWIYQPSTEFRWLMDLEKRPMQADEFLDFNYAQGKHTGLLEEWVQTSIDLGYPISHVVVEDNAAQRFLLQYDHVRRWMALRSVEIIPHSTHRNKSDAEYGVETIAQHYQFGRVRLPYKRNSQGWYLSQRLIDEVTHYPHSRTDDIVMAHWFLEWNLPRIYSPEQAEGRSWRPSWVADEVPDLRRRGNVESGAAAMMARAAGAMR
jgi:hypothetical protein